jgi:hypothetical protein
MQKTTMPLALCLNILMDKKLSGMLAEIWASIVM